MAKPKTTQPTEAQPKTTAEAEAPQPVSPLTNEEVTTMTTEATAEDVTTEAEAPAVITADGATPAEATEAPADGEAEAEDTKNKPQFNIRNPDGTIVILEKLEDYGIGASSEISNLAKIAASLTPAKKPPYVKQLVRDGKLVVTAKTTNLGDEDDPDYVTNFSIAKKDLADYLEAVASGKYKTRDKSNTAYIAKVLPGQEDAFLALVASNPTIFASVELRNKPKDTAEAPATEAPAFTPSEANIEAEAQRQARLTTEAPTAEAPAS